MSKVEQLRHVKQRKATNPSWSTRIADGLYLVRPDGYIGLTSNDVAEVQRYLAQTVGLAARAECVA